MTLRRLSFVALAALLVGGNALAQEAEERAWTFSASAYAYLIPHDDDYLQPTFTADWNRLHLEARYNYEDRGTYSLWTGYNFSVGEKVTFEGSLMAGAVFGDTDGVAPGYKATLEWKTLAFYSEGEYVFDTNDSSDDFFYAWSEFSWAPVDWFRFGLVGQRTKAYQTDRDIQRGLLLGFAYKRWNLTSYVFNPDDTSPTWVLALGVSF